MSLPTINDPLKALINKLDNDKVDFRGSSKIKMRKFLSFLNVEVVQVEKGFIGCDNGWTQYVGDDCLIIKGGKVFELGGEYLSSIEYGKNLTNPWNNYVNVLCLWEILNQEGQKWALEVYQDDIDKIINGEKSKASMILEAAKEKEQAFKCFTENKVSA